MRGGHWGWLGAKQRAVCGPAWGRKEHAVGRWQREQQHVTEKTGPCTRRTVTSRAAIHRARWSFQVGQADGLLAPRSQEGTSVQPSAARCCKHPVCCRSCCEAFARISFRYLRPCARELRPPVGVTALGSGLRAKDRLGHRQRVCGVCKRHHQMAAPAATPRRRAWRRWRGCRTSSGPILHKPEASAGGPRQGGCRRPAAARR